MARQSLWRPDYIRINKNKPPTMTNSTSADVTLEGAWCNRVAAKQEDSHSTAPAKNKTATDKWIKVHTTALVSHVIQLINAET